MVGYTLRQERERQNLSIEDIEQGTSIRTLYIKSIENGEYDKLPGTVYTKGFIKNYAKFLGLDADALAKEFAADIAELSAEQETTQDDAAQTAEQVEVKPVKPAKPEKIIGQPIRERRRNSSGILIVAAVVLIAALAGGAWAFLSDSDSDVAAINPPVKQTQPVTPETAPTVDPTPVAAATPAPKNDDIEIQARFNNRCWTLVTVDGAVVQEGIIEGGQTLSWTGKENITFRFGNAGAVELFRDGKSLGVPGAEGDIADKTFTHK